MYKIPASSGFETKLLHYLPSCHSTNEIAQQLVDSGSKNGTVVITDDQFAGKGQVGNTWESEPDSNLTFSLVYRPLNLKARDQFNISMLVSLAIRDCLLTILPGEVEIKWPNDLLFKRKKLGGILIESNLKGNQVESMIIGVGINVNQTVYETENATSMALELGRELDRAKLFESLYNNLMDNLQGADTHLRQNLRSLYHESLFGLGRRMKFNDGNDFEGVILGTDALGRLVIKKGEEQHAYQNKEVSFKL